MRAHLVAVGCSLVALMIGYGVGRNLRELRAEAPALLPGTPQPEIGRMPAELLNESPEPAARGPVRQLPDADVPRPPAAQPERTLAVCDALELLERAILADRPKERHDDAFAAKYAEASPEALHAALLIVSRAQEKLRAEIVAERLAQGLYEERGPNDARGAFGVTTTADSGPVSYGFESFDAGGEVVTRFTTIPPDEYPEYRSLELEWVWLKQRVKSLGFADCRPR